MEGSTVALRYIVPLHGRLALERQSMPPALHTASASHRPTPPQRSTPPSLILERGLLSLSNNSISLDYRQAIPLRRR